MRKPVTLTAKDRKLGADQLRFDSYYAALDGRVVYAKRLDRAAQMLDREAHNALKVV